MRIFAAVGTQKFSFNRLINALDNVSKSEGFEIFVQYGNSKRPEDCAGASFLESGEYQAMLGDADVVVVHGGIGTIRSALSIGAKVVVVPRRAVYGEHVDDHQAEAVAAFAEGGYVVPCYETQRLAEAIKDASCCDFPHFESAPCAIEDEISRIAVSWGFDSFLQDSEGSESR